MVLRDNRDDHVLGILTVTSVYRPDKVKEAQNVYGTTDLGHPAVAYLYKEAANVYIGGTVEGIARPTHYDFVALRGTWHSSAAARLFGVLVRVAGPSLTPPTPPHRPLQRLSQVPWPPQPTPQPTPYSPPVTPRSTVFPPFLRQQTRRPSCARSSPS